MAESLRVKFDKLNSENYFNWKYKMEMYLRKEKLWTFISADPPAIPAVGAAGADAAWVSAANQAIATATTTLNTFREGDDSARALIGLCVDDNKLVHIRNLTTAKATWNALQQYHEQNTLVNKVSIIRRICGLKLDEYGSMEAQISELTNLFQKLVDLGENQLNEQWCVAITLSSLPASYDNMITALEARPDADLTLPLVQSKLIGEYMKQKESKNGNVSKSNVESTVLKKTTQKLKFFFCKKSSHLKKDCNKYKEWLKKQ